MSFVKKDWHQNVMAENPLRTPTAFSMTGRWR